jgi:hypothetical protein
LLALAVAGCGGGGGATGPAAPADPGAGTSGGATEKQLQTTDAAALTAYFRDRLAATEPSKVPAGSGPRYAFLPASAQGSAATATPVAVSAQPTAATALAGAATADSTAGASSPVLQEAGVDEDDVLIANGAQVYALTPGDATGAGQAIEVRSVIGTGAALGAPARVALDATRRYAGLYAVPGAKLLATIGTPTVLAYPMAVAATASGGDAAVPATGAATLWSATTLAPVPSPTGGAPTGARIDLVDVADPAAPRLRTRLVLDGDVVQSRVVGNTLVLVVASYPAFAGFDWSWADTGPDAPNRRWLAALAADDYLPRIARDGQAPEPLVRASQCLVQPAIAPGLPRVTTLVAIDLASPQLTRQARCFAGSVETLYMTPTALYLATVRYPMALAGALPVFDAAQPSTDVHKFAFGPAGFDYRGSGSAPGRLSWGSDTARFMLGESGRDLRVVTSNDPWTTAGGATSPAQLTVLRDTGDGRTLAVVGSLPNARRPAPIGKAGEAVHGVRFVGSRAYVVTFQRTDPLFVLDLADSADPKLAGTLVVPGFSDRLYPIGDRLLLGVGRDALTFASGGTPITVNTGVLLSLYDVADPDAPREVARRTIGKRGSSSAADLSPHGLMLRPVAGRTRVALPVTVADGPVPYTAAGWPDEAAWHGFSRLAAYRFEIDPAAPALVERAPIVAPSPLLTTAGTTAWRAGVGAAFDRALDLDGSTWLYYDGQFAGAAW